MVDAIHLATWRRLAVVLCLSAAALGCGGPKQPTSPTANTASATGYNPSGAHNALLGPNELLSAGQGFLFTIRLPKGFKIDPASKAGDVQ